MQSRRSALSRLWHAVLVVLGAAVMVLGLFLVLPLIQVFHPSEKKVQLIELASGSLPPPPPLAPEPEPEKEPEEEEPPPEFPDEVPQLDLAQLELALEPGFQDGMLAGDFRIDLGGSSATGASSEDLFDSMDLDQEPRAIDQPGPSLSAKLRKQGPGTVVIVFIVDKNGKVESPQVQRSTDPVFDGPALSAVKRWRFEPGKRQGQPVRFRMRVPISFPAP